MDIVSKRSPLVRVLKSTRNTVKQLLDDFDRWIETVAMRSQNKDGSPFKRHHMVEALEADANLALSAVDVTLYELAGLHCDQLRDAGNKIYIMESNTFRRILYRLGQLFMSYQMDIEGSFPWLIRCTNDVYRDAPSQAGVYADTGREASVYTRHSQMAQTHAPDLEYYDGRPSH